MSRIFQANLLHFHPDSVIRSYVFVHELCFYRSEFRGDALNTTDTRTLIYHINDRLHVQNAQINAFMF